MDCSVEAGTYPYSSQSEYSSDFLYNFLKNKKIPFDQKQYTMYDSGMPGACQNNEVDMSVKVKSERPVLVGKETYSSDSGYVKALKKGALIVTLAMDNQIMMYYGGGIVDAVSCASGSYSERFVVPLVGYDTTQGIYGAYFITKWNVGYPWAGDNATMKIEKYHDFTPSGSDYGACGIYKDGLFLKMQNLDDD
jgi:hypothetical protein